MLDLSSCDGAAPLAPPAAPRTGWASLRQVVLGTDDLTAGAAVLAEELALGSGFADPLLVEHDIADHTVPVGPTAYLELVTPTRPGTPLDRRLARYGCGGYALSVQVPDAAACRDRAVARGIAIVVQTQFQGATIVQLHPSALGILLELDGVSDPECWFWDGLEVPAAPAPLVRDLVAVELAVGDPVATAALWRELLDLPGQGTAVHLGAREVRFVPLAAGRPGLRAIWLQAPAAADLQRLPGQLAGVDLRYVRA